MNYRLLLALLPFFVACGVTDSEEPTENPVRLQLGTETHLATQTIGTGGGTIVVPSTADTLGGITLTVPPDAYTDTKTFTISYAPITGIENGGDYTILSPAIIVENGGGNAEDMMTMKIPVKVPSDMFAMAFAWTEGGGFEALPIVDYDSGSVTLWSTHFEHSTIHDPPLEKRFSGQRTTAGGRTTIGIIARNIDKLMTGGTSTSFRPGTDDFPFRNFGSTVAPGGHCAGQSWAMMYYFMDHRKKNQPQLNGRFDNDGQFATPKIGNDDAASYRYCSVLQDNYNTFVRIGFTLDRQLQALNKTAGFRDSLTFMAYKLAMHVTKNPQFVTVWTSSSDAGHAMVVYAATANELKICDPNYPGNLPGGDSRVIRFSNGKFEPYASGATAEALGTLYPVIWFYGTTSGMNWTVAKEEWPGVPRRTAGVARFPSYTIKVRDTATAQYVVLTSGWKSTTGKMQALVESTTPLDVSTIFFAEGAVQQPVDDWFTVPSERKQFGFYLRDTSGPRPVWAGFKWVEVAGKDAPPPPRCTRDKTWETVLGAGHMVYTDSTSKGRRIVLEDLGSPEDICSDVHVHPIWEVTGDLSGMTVTASAYWSLFGDDKPMTITGRKGTATMEIGLKQAFDDDPGYIGLQTEFIFPSRGSLAADLAWFRAKKVVAKITMEYKEHAE